MADNFASYFPVTVTGGTTNPMVGANVVQGPNPQALGLDPILAAIQSQYTPQTFTHSGGSYGAQRFIDGSSGVSGFTPPVIGGGNIAQPWFTPGAFNLADYQTDLPSDLAEQVATGSVYGGDSYSPVSNVGNESWMSDPYAGLDPITGLRSGVNAFIPGAGLLIGAAQGYSGATSANTLNDVLNYLGDEGLGKVDPLKATALGAFGITPQSLKDAQEFYKIFDQNSATMLNWAAQPKDTASNQIVDFLMEGAQNPLSPQDIGVMSWAVRSDIDQAVASGKPLSDAVIDVAISKGIDPTRAAEMGVAASRSAVEQGLKQGLSLDDMDPAAVAVYSDPMGALMESLGISQITSDRIAAEKSISDSIKTVEQGLKDGLSLQDMNPLDVAAYNDPLGALIDSMGITGKINESVAAATTPINDKIEGLAASDEAFQKAIAGLNFATPEDVAAAVGNLNYATADDIVNALADLNYTTPEYIDAVLADLNFSTPEDVTNALANAGFASTDDISNAIAGLDIPTVDDIVSAIATPVTGEVTSGTSFQPANADGSFVSGIPDVGVPDSIDGVTFDNVIGAISTPVYSPDLPTPTPIAPGSQYDSGVTTTSPSRSISGVTTTPSVDYGSIADFGGTGSDSYAPTANEISFSESGGYTADVGGYDATSGYDTDTDSGGGGGGSSSGGGGKIVCTAMNQSYGFGSYRNAIWLKYSADKMTKAHEAGYHAIFLPLVDLAYKRNNKPFRIALEHIARHRTADLRAEMRGSKRNTLGRAYRFVLEPLCYVVGKIKGY